MKSIMLGYTSEALCENSTTLGPFFGFATECRIVCGDISTSKVILGTRIREILLIMESIMLGYTSEALCQNSTTLGPFFGFAIECRLVCGDISKSKVILGLALVLRLSLALAVNLAVECCEIQCL